MQNHALVVTADQMRQIETGIFQQGMPVEALMEKAAGLMVEHICCYYPQERYQRIGLIAGPGHNGGDTLVIARELYFRGYKPLLHCPLKKFKALTQQHFDYANYLGITCTDEPIDILACDLIVDGLFGFGLERSLSGTLADLVHQLNQSNQPVVSVDLPSGLHTDTGEVLGTAVQATESLCLGLWKQAYVQEQAVPYIGKATRLDFGIPGQILASVLGAQPQVKKVTAQMVRQYLPLQRSPLTHKYRQGHLLLIGGSRTYAGSILLAGLGARATGLGMLSVVVPESLRELVVGQLPEALVIGCPESQAGAIAKLPDLDFSRYGAIACGCGLTLAGAATLLPSLLQQNCPLVLDADALNWLAQGHLELLHARSASTILTPHLGEFRRLFPDLIEAWQGGDRVKITQLGARSSRAIALLKGARTIIAHPDGQTYGITESTPALARGGSGDVLLGVLGGLLCQHPDQPLEISATAAWWHAQAALLAAVDFTLAGVDGVTLGRSLGRILKQFA